MSILENTHLRDKLFRISTRPRPLTRNEKVVLPTELKPIEFSKLFRKRQSFKVLELGSGWGEFCLRWLEENPEHEYLAFEIKPDRIKKLLKRAEKRDLHNFRVVPVNFNWFLEEILPPETFDLIIVNFPDPWPKKRHWKHRLVQDEFPARVENLLRPGGAVFIATDYGPYARVILRRFRNSTGYKPVYPWPHYLRSRPENHPRTRFEEIHLGEGRVPYYQKWERIIGNESDQTFRPGKNSGAESKHARST